MPLELLNPVERLARRLCKELPPGRAVCRIELHDTLERQALRHSMSRKLRRASKIVEGDFERAVELAVVMGWVEATPQACRLTADGAEFAKRTRVGVHRTRSLL
jgi:hypothetical protein